MAAADAQGREILSKISLGQRLDTAGQPCSDRLGHRAGERHRRFEGNNARAPGGREAQRLQDDGLAHPARRVTLREPLIARRDIIARYGLQQGET